MRQRFDALADQYRRLTAAVDRLALAVFVLDGDGPLVRTNAAADRFRSAGLGLRVRRGKLAAAHPASEAALARAVTAASAAPRWGRPPAHTFLLRAANGVSTHATLHRLASGGGGTLALFVRPIAGGKDAGVLVEALAGAYGLTVGEAALAQALAAHRDLTSAAAGPGITAATARTRLKAVFDKLGVGNQAELVAVLGGLQEVLGSQRAAPRTY